MKTKEYKLKVGDRIRVNGLTFRITSLNDDKVWMIGWEGIGSANFCVNRSDVDKVLRLNAKTVNKIKTIKNVSLIGLLLLILLALLLMN